MIVIPAMKDETEFCSDSPIAMASDPPTTASVVESSLTLSAPTAHAVENDGDRREYQCSSSRVECVGGR